MKRRLTALKWLQSFRMHFRALPIEGGIWSPHMFETLHAVRDDFGLWCKCEFGEKSASHGVKGEFLKIDMMWFPKGERTGEYDVPVFALEHENRHTDYHAKEDFWRVFQVAAPLRVFIGYAMENRATALVDALSDMRWVKGRDRFNQLPGGEDIALVGAYPMQGWESWQGVVWSNGQKFSLTDFMRAEKRTQ